MAKERQISYYNIFKYIVKKGETTRREIEKDTGYSWGTVSSNVCALMDDGFVKETRNVINGVGRSTYYLSTNGKYVTIGVDVNAIGLSCTIAEINGKELFFFTSNFKANNSEEVISLVLSTFDKAFEWVGKNYNVFSIGLSCQGGADRETGFFNHFNFIKDWKPINFKSILEEKYHIFAIIANDMEALKIDYMHKYPLETDPVSIIRLVDGIGFTFTPLDAVLTNFMRCEFGHMIMNKEGNSCICGKRGCLETYASIRGLLNRCNLNISDREKLFLEQEKYQKYIDEAADYLGLAILNILSGFVVKKVILTGRMIDFGPKFINDIYSSYTKYRNNSKLNEDIEVIGDSSLSPSLGIAMLSVEEKLDYEKQK